MNPTCVTLTLEAVSRTAPSPFPSLWHLPAGFHPHSVPTRSGIWGCASANHEASHRPACAAIR